MWVFFTLFAAFMQAWRNVFQAQLSKDVGVVGVTLARFRFAGPIAAAYLVMLNVYHPQRVVFALTDEFILYGLGAAGMQIIATALMVMLFKFKGYVVGAGLAKSEVLIAAILGGIWFSTSLSLLGWAGVTVGAVAVFIMGSKKSYSGFSSKVIVVGLLCGGCFALTSLWVREASLSLALPYTHSAAWLLLFVTCVQTVLLSAYLLGTNKREFIALFNQRKRVLLTGISSCLGSIGWYTAMSIQAVPYVKTLGQVEVFYTLFIAVYWLKSGFARKDILGLISISIASIFVLWGV